MHDLGQEGDIERGLGSFGIIMPFEDILVLERNASKIFLINSGTPIKGEGSWHYLMESTLMPVLLQELLLALRFIRSQFLRAL